MSFHSNHVSSHESSKFKNSSFLLQIYKTQGFLDIINYLLVFNKLDLASVLVTWLTTDGIELPNAYLRSKNFFDVSFHIPSPRIQLSVYMRCFRKSIKFEMLENNVYGRWKQICWMLQVRTAWKLFLVWVSVPSRCSSCLCSASRFKLDTTLL